MMELIPFDPVHLHGFTPHARQANADLSGAWFDGVGVTLMDGDDVVAAGGLIPIWSGRVLAWAIISKGANMWAVTRAAGEFLRRFQELPRIEATIDLTFPEAIRWIELLGFQREGTMRKCGPNGEDFAMYSRVN